MTVGVAPTARPSRSPSPAGGSSAAAAPLLPMATRPPPSGGGGGGRRGRLPTALLAALSFGGLCLFLAVAPQAPRLGPPVGEPAGAAGGGGPAVSSVPPPPPVARAAAAASASDASAAVGANAEEHPQVPPSAEALKALWMTPEEAASMLEVMRKDMVYLEYGSGGSTMAFAPLAARAYSVEHNGTTGAGAGGGTGGGGEAGGQRLDEWLLACAEVGGGVPSAHRWWPRRPPCRCVGARN